MIESILRNLPTVKNVFFIKNLLLMVVCSNSFNKNGFLLVLVILPPTALDILSKYISHFSSTFSSAILHRNCDVNYVIKQKNTN